MFDLGWSELLVIGIVALIVVGPKDLPVMFRKLGEFTGKARRMAREFQNAMNDAARESGVDEVSSDLRKIANPKKYGVDAIKDATKDLTRWEPDETTGPNTRALSEKREAQRAKIEKAQADAALARQAREREALQPDPGAAPPAAADAPAPEQKADSA